MSIGAALGIIMPSIMTNHIRLVSAKAPASKAGGALAVMPLIGAPMGMSPMFIPAMDEACWPAPIGMWPARCAM